MNTVILAFETSCDDTSVAILVNGDVKSCRTYSQLKEHAIYGGVIPEIAARTHYLKIDILLKECLEESKLDLKSLTHIAYTELPGLISGLFVGKIFADSLGLLLGIPVIGINHLHAHIFSAEINNKKATKYPIIGGIFSGGHSSIYLVKNLSDITLLVETTDDAVGETLDKIGRELKVEYPYAPNIEKLALRSENTPYSFTTPQLKTNFSFSGIKSQAFREIEKNKLNLDPDFCNSIQEFIFNYIATKIKKCAQKYNAPTIMLGGGVCANNRLKKIIYDKINNKEIFYPEIKYALDNAAMIGYLAFKKINLGLIDENNNK